MTLWELVRRYRRKVGRPEREDRPCAVCGGEGPAGRIVGGVMMWTDCPDCPEEARSA
jgi:hypothetical protein